MPLRTSDITILNHRNSPDLLALFGLFLMNAENFAKMSAPTSKDSLLSGLRWGYLQQRGWRWKGWFLRINHHHTGSLSTLWFLFPTVPGRSQHLLQKLLDFDEVCFESAVVEEKRRVSARGEVFELRWLPVDGGERWKRGSRTETRDSILLIRRH